MKIRYTAIGIFVTAIISMCFIANVVQDCGELICFVANVTESVELTYSRTYDNGFTTNDDASDNIITVRPIINNSPSSFELTFYLGNHTLIINQENIKDITLHLDRAISREGEGDYDYYIALLTNPLYIKVYGTSGQKNLTLVNLSTAPARIVKDGQDIPFTYEDKTLTLSVNPTGNYTIYFNIDISPSGILTDDEIDFLADICFYGIILIIVVVILAFLVNVFKGGG